MFSEEMICSLNDLELEVYKYVVRNADKVCYMRIREFADAAHVSTSTILRFCKKAGCDGYAEFKIRLRQHLEQAKQPPVKDDVSEVIDFLKKTCSAEFEQKLDMLTRVIFQARHIFLWAAEVPACGQCQHVLLCGRSAWPQQAVLSGLLLPQGVHERGESGAQARVPGCGSISRTQHERASPEWGGPFYAFTT